MVQKQWISIQGGCYRNTGMSGSRNLAMPQTWRGKPQPRQLHSLEVSTTKYPSVAHLYADQFPLIVPTTLLQLQEVLAHLPEAVRFAVLPRIYRR
jgi:hypothetical protein